MMIGVEGKKEKVEKSKSPSNCNIFFMADFYLRAAKVLDGHSNQTTSLKSLVKSNSKDESDAKRLLKLSISTLEYLNILKQLIKLTQIQSLESKAFGERDQTSTKAKRKEKEKEKDLQDSNSKSTTSTSSPSPTSLLLVLLHDLLFSPKNQISSSSNWPPRIALERHKARLKAELIKIQLKNGASRLVDLKSGGQERKISERIPRWIRINEGKISVEKCLESLSKSGWKLGEDDDDEKKGVVAKK